jgi:glycosyltransferase involved in cell wall biosynthesis
MVKQQRTTAHSEIPTSNRSGAGGLAEHTGSDRLVDLGRGPLVLLFYDGYERQAASSWPGRIRSDLRGRLRAVWRRARGKQVNTGFYTAFLGLVAALRRIGCDVRINDFARARRMPTYPIGIAGYPSILARVASLPNPMLFGPGDPGHPEEAGRLRGTTTIHHIIQPSDWYVDLYRPSCGNAVVRWPVGIDVEAIPDAADHAKTVDIVVYDKIRWHRDRVVPAVQDRLIRHLDARGLSWVVLRYGHHTREEYFAALRTARAMAFLCEHETQGLACEEALAMNVPVFAWDEGELVDPIQRPMAPPGLRASSVPYFDDRCGVRFDAARLEPCFDAFWARRATFRPREYIAGELGLEKSARDYLALLTDTARD